MLNRAAWSGLALSQQLLLVLVSTLVPAGATVVLGADETLERRRGAYIAELGCNPMQRVQQPATRSRAWGCAG